MNSKFIKLFSPIAINKTMLKNRIVSTPLGMNDISELEGPGYVIKGSVAVEAPNAMWGPIPYAFRGKAADELHEWIIKAHAKGMKAGVELIHCGNQARAYDKPYVFGPSTTTNDEGYHVKAMDEDDMQLVIDAYAKAAKDAVILGVDILFLHFAHGWLPAEFLSPLHNHRIDEYGGSLKKRAKFPLRILQAVRKAVGPNYPIDMRISAVEHVEGSITFEDTLAFIGLAKEYIDAVQISCGLDKGFQYKGNVKMSTTIFERRLLNVEYASMVKQAYPDLIVGVVGGIETPAEAEEIIENKKIDLVAIGRALLADPEWARKALENREDEIRPCVRCLQCYHISTEYKNIGCTVNPRFHHHAYIPKQIQKNICMKKVVVIGGGPAGISAAIAANKKGNHVILFEKENQLGGMLRYITQEHYKEDMKRYYNWLLKEVGKYDIDIRLNTEATPEMIQSIKPDYLILAVGSKPKIPPIKGCNLLHVHNCLDGIDNYNQLGKNIVIVGGGSIGSEIALGAAEIDKKNVTLIEMSDRIASNGNMLYRVSMQQHMDQCQNLKIFKNSQCKEISENFVIINTKDGLKEIPYDDVIIASGMEPKTELAQSFFGITAETCIIGDSNSVRLIQEANLEGTLAGLRTE
ncbi:MAG: FAD-dependent oxidoreductase [Erysipelotrichaceae bacterium]|nr:FAD-dependent oxidoreductase [Erysipelotrichaceae bacterium]